MKKRIDILLRGLDFLRSRLRRVWQDCNDTVIRRELVRLTPVLMKQNSPSACVRFQENPYWHGERPFLLCPYIPVDDELYGIGLIEPITEKWNELNTTIRQVVDNKTLQLLNPTIEDVHANVQRDIKLIKFPRIKADDVNAVIPLPINDFSNNGYKVISSIKTI